MKGSIVRFAIACAWMLSAAGCVVDVDLGGSRLVCSDGRCPGGFTCVEERCVPEGGGQSDAAAGDDAAPADSGPDPDADPPPDAAPPDAPAPTACEAQYGRAPGFVLCAEERGSCQFYVNTGEVAQSCSDLCLDVGGGLCLAANNSPADAPARFECVLQEETPCGEVINSSQVCTCTSK